MLISDVQQEIDNENKINDDEDDDDDEYEDDDLLTKLRLDRKSWSVFVCMYVCIYVCMLYVCM